MKCPAWSELDLGVGVHLIRPSCVLERGRKKEKKRREERGMGLLLFVDIANTWEERKGRKGRKGGRREGDNKSGASAAPVFIREEGEKRVPGIETPGNLSLEKKKKRKKRKGG